MGSPAQEPVQLDFPLTRNPVAVVSTVIVIEWRPSCFLTVMMLLFCESRIEAQVCLMSNGGLTPGLHVHQSITLPMAMMGWF